MQQPSDNSIAKAKEQLANDRKQAVAAVKEQADPLTAQAQRLLELTNNMNSGTFELANPKSETTHPTPKKGPTFFQKCFPCLNAKSTEEDEAKQTLKLSTK